MIRRGLLKYGKVKENWLPEGYAVLDGGDPTGAVLSGADAAEPVSGSGGEESVCEEETEETAREDDYDPTLVMYAHIGGQKPYVFEGNPENIANIIMCGEGQDVCIVDLFGLPVLRTYGIYVDCFGDYYKSIEEDVLKYLVPLQKGRKQAVFPRQIVLTDW